MAGRSRKTSKRQPARSRYFIEALGRGLDVLALFDTEHPNLSLTEIAKRLNCVPSTALRFIQTLVDLDYLEELTETSRYRPSLAALKLGHRALSTSPLRSLARPFLEALHAETGESVNLAMLARNSAILVDGVASPDALSIEFRAGSRFPAIATAVGKILLSQYSADELNKTLSAVALPKLGPNSITTVKDLDVALRAVRREGFAIEDEELAAGLRGVAAGVTNGSGKIKAAIGIIGGSSRISVDRLRKELAPLVVKAAKELSAKLEAGPRHA